MEPEQEYDQGEYEEQYEDEYEEGPGEDEFLESPQQYQGGGHNMMSNL